MTDNDSSKPVDSADDWVRSAGYNRHSFGQLFDLFYPQILAYCARRLLVRAVAEDVTSEVFLKVASGIHDFSGVSVEDFRRWLFRIATNEIKAELRKSIRRRELFDAAVRLGRIGGDGATKPPLACEASVDDWESIYRAIGTLPDREQSIVSLRFFAGLNYEQIAGILEIKTGTLRVAVSRALDKLRDRLRADVMPGHSTPGSRGADE